MPKARVDGIELYYELYGQALTPTLRVPGVRAETVLFANGVLADTQSWWGQVPVFAKNYRVLLFDFRGQGKSDKPDEPYSMEGHAADAVGLLDLLKIERVHWVSVSYGGEVGMIVTARYPRKIASLTVAAAVSHVAAPLRDGVAAWIAAAQTGDMNNLFELTAPQIFSARFCAENPKFLEMARERYRRLAPHAVVRLLEAFQRLNVTPELQKITAPTLVLCASDDQIKPCAYAQLIHQKIVGSEFALIPDCGHALTFEKSKEFNSLVLSFLHRVRERVTEC